ncbi:MAG: exodeoxyribonuclease VII small subunit [Firmicutes bacterium]|nr:exodeoxyribonuclease VII small subunit [Bacillota bacterium]
MKEKDFSQLSYEEAFSRLERIVEALERGDQGLDESLKLFEEGIQLSSICNKRLNEAEARLEKLVQDASGHLRREEFTVQPEEQAGEENFQDDLPF